MPRLVTALALVALLGGCDFEGGSLYDPDAERNSAPVVSDVASPFTIVLAGVDVVTVTGQNFSTTLGDNIVVFDDGLGNSAAGTVISATPTQLEVKVPNLPNAALRMRVAVIGSPEYSNAVPYPLTPAFVRAEGLGQTEVPAGIATDTDGVLFVSLANEGTSIGVVRLEADGTRAPYFASTFLWPGLGFNGDQLIGVRRVRAVFGLPEGGSQQVVAALQPSSLSLVAVASGPDGSIYTGGNVPTIFQIRPDGSSVTTDLASPVTALKVVGETLYAATSSEAGTGRLLSLSIAGDGTLGAPTIVADLPAPATGIASAADGTLYVGLARDVDPMVTVSLSGTVSTLYPGVITGPALGLAYGVGTQLYMVRGMPVPVSGQTPPPPTVIRIETRRDGTR